MKPNHHYAAHMPAQIRDYGPVYNFWTFLTERLNKVLKGFELNGWGGGKVEETMMREFMRASSLKTMVSILFYFVECH